MAIKQKMTLEKLARLVTKGFEGTASRQDLESLSQNMAERFEDSDSHFRSIEQKLDSMESELRDIGVVLGPLVRTVAAMEIDLRDLRSRVNRLERKAGIPR
jgi:hypothetical protein